MADHANAAMCTAWGIHAVTAHPTPTNPRSVTRMNFKVLNTTKRLLLNLNHLHHIHDGIWNYQIKS